MKVYNKLVRDRIPEIIEADVLEVLQAICLARGYNLDELEEMKAKKANVVDLKRRYF